MSEEVEAPEEMALYRIRGEGGVLLYIGITKSVPVRWNDHSLKQPWWGELRSLTVEPLYGSRKEAEAAEEAAIRAERPKYNKRHNDGLAERPAKPERCPVIRMPRQKRPVQSPAKRYFMKVDELRALPAYVDLTTAGRAWSISPATSFKLAKAGEFPCPVHREGRTYRVLLAELMTSLGIEQDGQPLPARASEPAA